MEDFNAAFAHNSTWYKDEQQLKILKDLGWIKESMIAILPEIADVLQDVYPNLWEITLSLHRMRTGNIYITIRFPELEISNSRNQKHTLYDIFFRFKITSDGEFRLREFKGTRTTLSIAEFINCYLHSHLESKDMSNLDLNDFTTYCLGDGEINQTITMINASDFDANLFKMFLLQIKIYLEWESLEGGPHIKMNDVVIRGESGTIPTPNISVLSELGENIQGHRINIESLTLDLDGNNRVFLVDDDEFENFTLNLYKQTASRSYRDKYLCYKDSEGNYCGTEFEISRLHFKPVNLLFRGEELPFKIKEELPERNGMLYLHPKIKEFYKIKFQYELTKKQIKDNAFR